jgi:hypothetical protein
MKLVPVENIYVPDPIPKGFFAWRGHVIVKLAPGATLCIFRRSAEAVKWTSNPIVLPLF